MHRILYASIFANGKPGIDEERFEGTLDQACARAKEWRARNPDVVLAQVLSLEGKVRATVH